MKNNSATAAGVIVEFAGQIANPNLPDGPFVVTQQVNDTLSAYATREYKFVVPATITSLNFIRIRRR